MVTQTLTPVMDRIDYKGKTYLMPHQDLVEVFEILGKASKPCEFGVCGHINLVPKRRWFNKEFWQKCIYQPKDLEWEVTVSEGEGFLPKTNRCVDVDNKLKEYLEAGILDEYIQ